MRSSGTATCAYLPPQGVSGGIGTETETATTPPETGTGTGTGTEITATTATEVTVAETTVAEVTTAAVMAAGTNAAATDATTGGTIATAETDAGSDASFTCHAPPQQGGVECMQCKGRCLAAGC